MSNNHVSYFCGGDYMTQTKVGRVWSQMAYFSNSSTKCVKYQNLLAISYSMYIL